MRLARSLWRPAKVARGSASEVVDLFSPEFRIGTTPPYARLQLSLKRSHGRFKIAVGLRLRMRGGQKLVVQDGECS
jgi:hypothetical protein